MPQLNSFVQALARPVLGQNGDHICVFNNNLVHRAFPLENREGPEDEVDLAIVTQLSLAFGYRRTISLDFLRIKFKPCPSLVTTRQFLSRLRADLALLSFTWELY